MQHLGGLVAVLGSRRSSLASHDRQRKRMEVQPERLAVGCCLQKTFAPFSHKHQSAHNLRERETPTSAYPIGYKNINTSSSSPSLLVKLHQKSRREAKTLHARYQTSKAADSFTRQSHTIIELLQSKEIVVVPGPRIHRSTSTIQSFDSQNRGSCEGCLCAYLRRAESYHSMSGPSDEALFSA
jgi:hypothetical protein